MKSLELLKTSINLKHFVLIFLNLLLLSNTLKAQSPGGVSTGLTVWLKANVGTTTAGANLTGWTDQSGVSTPITINGSPDMVANGYNFNPYINFTLSSPSGGDFLHIPNLNLRSFFWVAQLNDLNRAATHLATYDGVTLSAPCSGCPIHGGSNGGSVAQYHELGYGSANFQAAGVWRKNGDPAGTAYNTAHTGKFDIVTALGNSAVPTNVFMGGQNDNLPGFNGRLRDWLGPVGEIISYSGALTPAQANKVETYLAVKYGITLGGNGSTTLFYTSPTGNTIWNVNTGYHYHVAGIGNDMALEGLDQPKSHSIHTPLDAITMANSNFVTPTSMVAGDYLLWGHNNGSLSYTCQNFNHATPTTVISALYNRVWRTQKTGTPAGNVIIEVDMSLLQGPSGLGTATNADVRLLIDNNTIFSDGSAGEYTISPNAGFTATGGMVYFTVPYANIQSGQGFFGIGLASPVPVANAGSDIPVCSGISGSIGVASTAGFTYSWSPSTGLSSATSSNPTITLTNGTGSTVISNYTVTTTTTATGCTATDNVDVTVNPIENASFTTSPTCTGGTSTITGTTGGTFTFTVAPGDGATINAATGTVSGGTSGTTYQITYTTSGTCSATSNGSVTALTQENASFTTTPTCTGGTATITGTAGGSFAFTVTPGDGAMINAVNGTVSGGTYGSTYQITYTTPGSCSASSNGSVTALTQENASFTTSPTCTGGTSTITGTAGGTFTFTVAPGDGATINSSTGTVSGGTSGSTYQITYTTSGTCFNSSNGSVTALNQEDASFTTTPTCGGGTATITGTAGGTFTFTVAPGDGATINSSTGTVSNGTAATTYQITYTTPGSCFASSNGTVTALTLDDASFTTTPTCDGGTATITGTAGGTFTFTVAPGDGASLNSSTGTITSGTSGSTYQITYTTSGSCSATSNGSVTALNQEDASFTTTPTCGGGTATITGTAGGTFTFTVAPADGATINSTSGTVSNGTSGSTYQITYTTSGACFASSNGSVTALIQDDASFTTSATCVGGTASITGTTGGIFAFAVSPGDGAIINNSTGTVTNGTSGTNYQITYTTSGVCFATSSEIMALTICDIPIPTAFTPNGDNTNDTWELIDLDILYPDNVVSVYNRWGSLLFESSKGKYEQNPWNGNFEGKALPVGSYYFIIEYNAPDKESDKGNVSIIR